MEIPRVKTHHPYPGSRSFGCLFSTLRSRHCFSEAAELISLQTVGLQTIELDYKEAKKEDEYGNYFRYRAKVKGEQGAQISRWAWDVFLLKR